MCTYSVALGFTYFMFKPDTRPQTNGSYTTGTNDNPRKNPVTTSDSVNNPTPIAVEVVGKCRSLFKEFFAYGCPKEWREECYAAYRATMWFSVTTGALFQLTEMYMSSRWLEIQPLANSNALIVLLSSWCDIGGSSFVSDVVVKKFGPRGHFCLVSIILAISGLNFYLGSVTNIYCAYGAYLIFALLKRICRATPQQYVSLGLREEDTQKHTTVTMSKFNSLGMLIGFLVSSVICRLFAKLKSHEHPLSMMYHLCGIFYLVAFALFLILLVCCRKLIQDFMNNLFTGQNVEEANDTHPEGV
jgi:hypothetical protein